MFDRDSWGQWRALYDALLSYPAEHWERDVLLPWAGTNQPAIDELHRIGLADSRYVTFARDRDFYTPLEVLYVLSRVLDVLIAPYQNPVDDPAALNPSTGRPWWTGRLPPHAGYPTFCAALGCHRIEEADFHPFLHEIVTVLPADDPDQPVRLVNERWPGYFVGSMLLTRAGVTVQAGANRLVPEVAERSSLYWAWWRRNRPTCDLSHGWGSNSQWGTNFRRDYWAKGQLHYNVDAANRVPISRPELAPDAAHDLLRHRCGTTIDPGTYQSIWDTHLTEPAPR